MNTRIYNWFVARGNIKVSSDENHVIVNADPEGSAYCVMTAQDASEIASIIAGQARGIWEASDKAPQPKASVEGDASSSKLKTDSGVISVVAHDSKPLVALAYEGHGAIVLNVTQAVALVQLIEYTLEYISSR